MIKIGITGQAGFVGTHLYNTLGLHPEEFERIDFQKFFSRMGFIRISNLFLWLQLFYNKEKKAFFCLNKKKINYEKTLLLARFN